jgi:alpha-glutamyl/putrescinyl thymine pyrophosphorylase clade 1
VYDLLHGYPLMGDFMSYQTTIDLNYSGPLEFSENEFTQAGPGALRASRSASGTWATTPRPRSCCG